MGTGSNARLRAVYDELGTGEPLVLVPVRARRPTWRGAATDLSPQLDLASNVD